MLHGLIEDALNDIVVRLDSRGFIIHASANAIELGIDPATLLVMPHISDLADPDHADDLTRHVAQVLADGDRSGWRSGWTEFPLCPLREPGVESEDAGDAARRRRWYALSLRAIAPDDNVPQGALGLLRSVDHGYALGSELGARAAIDLQTGLANRRSFCAALARVIDSPGVSRPRVSQRMLQIPGSCSSTNSPSHLPFVAVRNPKSRAGRTLVLLNTNKSPGSRKDGSSRICECTIVP